MPRLLLTKNSSLSGARARTHTPNSTRSSTHTREITQPRHTTHSWWPSRMRAMCACVVCDEGRRHSGARRVEGQWRQAHSHVTQSHKQHSHCNHSTMHTASRTGRHTNADTLHSHDKFKVCSCVNLAREGANALAPSARRSFPEHTHNSIRRQYIGESHNQAHNTHSWWPSRMRAM